MGILSMLGVESAPGTGILGDFAQGLRDNRNALLGYGFGGASGFANGVQADQQSRLFQQREEDKKQQKVAAEKMAAQLGLDPSFASDPEAVRSLFTSVMASRMKPKEPTEFEQLTKGMDPALVQQAKLARLGLGGDKPTDDVREYRLAQQQGYTGSFLDYQTAIKKAGAQSISIDQKAESTEEVERAKANTKYLSDLSAQSGTIARRSADLDFLGRVVSRTNTGSGADTRAMLDGVGSSLGMSPGTLKTQADAIKAVTNRIAPTLREAGSGSQSDAELAGFLSALPNLTATPEGNQLIQATLQRAAKIDRERTKIASQFSAGRITATQARQRIAELDEQSIYASEEEKKIIDNAMGFAPLSGGDKGAKGWKILGWE